MKKVRVATIGYGHLGRWHAQKAQQLESAELVAIVESFGPNKEKAVQAHPNVKIADEISEVADEIDAAVIVTPTSTHFELAQTLLKKGKHVFCEKPMTATLSEALALEECLQEGQVLQVGHSERCHQAWELLEGRFDGAGASTLKIDRVAAFKGRATDVDVVQDLMIHDLDLALFLLQKKPAGLKAYGHKIRTGKWDQADAVLDFEDGSVAMISSGRNHVKEIRSLSFANDRGMLFVDLFGNTISEATPSRYADGSYVKEYPYEKRDHLLIEQERFYRSVLEGEKPMVGYRDGFYAVKLVQAVLDSLETGKRIDV